MGIGLSGMISGLDTDSLIKQLMSAERTRVTKVDNKITKNEWKVEKWKSLNSKIYSLYTGSLAKMKTQGNYLAKKTTSSNDKVVSVKAGASAPIGTHYVTVNKVASSQYVSGGKFQTDQKMTSKSKMTDAGVAAGTKITLTVGEGANQKVKEFIVDENTTFADFSEAGKEVGLNINLDEARQSLYINSKQSGTDNKFTITTSTVNPTFAAAQSGVRDAINYNSLSAAEKAEVDSDLATMDTLPYSSHLREIIRKKEEDGTELSEGDQKIYDAYKRVQARAEKNIAEGYAKKDVEADVASQLASAIESGEAVTIYGKTVSAEELTQLKAEAQRKADTDGTSLEDEIRAYAADEASKYLGSDEAKAAIAAKTTEIQNGTVVPEGYEADKAGKMESFDKALNSYIYYPSHDDNPSALTAIGLSNVTGAKVENGADPTGMTVFEAGDAEVSVNGQVITSSSNTVNVNGLTLDLLSAKPDETISVTVSQNTDSVYDMVKQFVKDYNEVLEEMNKAYYAESARGYEPLTDDQRDAMSDSEVEKWETKIKDSLLRRDNTLGSLITAMRSVMNESVSIDGKNYSFASFGITTTKYSEKGKLHIYGDQDDSEGMTYDDKLRAAIEEDPDKVMEVLQTISKKLYDTMSDKMKATELSSALTFYNDKQLTKEMNSYKKEKTKEESRLTTIEDRYYKQFANMEKALSMLSSQSNSLLMMLGQNTY